MTGWLSASDGEKERAEQKNNIYKSCVQFSRVYFILATPNDFFSQIMFDQP